MTLYGRSRWLKKSCAMRSSWRLLRGPNRLERRTLSMNWWAGTRAGQFLALGAKARALLKGRSHVTIEDIQTLAYPVLRHRVLLNYRAEAEGVTVETVIKRLIETIKAPIK